MKHSPAPWTVEDGEAGSGYGKYQTEFIRDANGDVVATMADFASADRAANANLVAAAPEMLGALKIILRQPCPKDTNGDGDCGRVACPFCGLTKIVIGKAEGK